MIKNFLITITLLVAAGFPAVSFSDDAVPSSIPPVVDLVELYFLTDVMNGSVEVECGTSTGSCVSAASSSLSGAGYEVCGQSLETLGPGSFLAKFESKAPVDSGNCPTRFPSFPIKSRMVERPTCPDPNYPFGVDIDADGLFDHCTNGQDACDSIDPFPAGDNASFSRVCAQHPQIPSISCEMGMTQNPDGSISYSATSEQCDCEPFAALPCVNENAQLPNPSDPDDSDNDGTPDAEDTNGAGDGSSEMETNPGDQDGDGTDQDDLNQAGNEILKRILESVDELEALQKIANYTEEEQRNILEIIARNTQETQLNLRQVSDTLRWMLDNGIKIQGDGGSGGGGGGGDGGGDGSGGGDDDGTDDGSSCAGYFIGNKCVIFNNLTRPTVEEVDTSIIDTEVTQARSKLDEKFNQIKAELNEMFEINLSVGGSFQTNNVNIAGQSVNLSVGQHIQKMDLGSLFLFFAYLGALVIILGSRQ